MEKTLKEHLRFERLISEISARFVNISPDQVDLEIENDLKQILEFFQVDRCGLLSAFRDSASWQVTHAAFSEGIATVPVKTDLPVTLFPWLYKKLVEQGEVSAFSSIEELPAEAHIDKQTYSDWGVRSSVDLPISIDGNKHYILAIQTMRSERVWPDEYILRLRLLGEIFAHALARKRADQALRESEARLDLAASSAEAGLWILDMSTRHFWATAKARELFGYDKEQEITFETFLHTVHPDDREDVRRAVDQSIRAQENLKVEYRIVLTDESIRWIISCGRPYFSESGEPERMMGVSMDITARKKSEESLNKAYDEIKQLRDELKAENIYLRQEVSRASDFEQIIGRSGVLMKVLHQVAQVAATGSTVLLSGETGTGKELIAQAIHNLSPRHSRLMVKVNCAALPAALIESELFGRERGAYTGALARQIGRFELADRSTLLLDEITELPLDLQAKLLRVLQDGEFERLGSPKTIRVDVRLVAATNRDMAQEVRKGAFRADLYYRLNVFPIEVPPLRERPDDIPLLVEAFVHEFAVKMGKKIQTVPQKTMEALQRYRWPGNIRELRNVLEQAIIISNGSSLQIHLPQAPAGASFKNQTMEETEYQHIMDVLSKTGWRIKGFNGAAALLGLKPSTLYSRMNKLGIPNRREKDGISP